MLVDQKLLSVQLLLLCKALDRTISEQQSFQPLIQEKTLHRAITRARVGMTDYFEILTDAEDTVSSPEMARQVGRKLGIAESRMPNQGNIV